MNKAKTDSSMRQNERTVVLVDDHHLVRAGIRSLLDDLEGYHVVAEGDDGEIANDLVATYQPDILVMDIAMKKVSGLEALKMVRQQHPEVAVILLSMHATRDYLQQAFEYGAQAYLLKDSAEIELELALKAVEAGERYVSPRLSEKLLEALMSPSLESQPNRADEDVPLTKRQKEILIMIARGKGTKEIAYDLNVSAKTVESHRAQIMERLNIRDVASLVRYAIRKGLVSVDE